MEMPSRGLSEIPKDPEIAPLNFGCKIGQIRAPFFAFQKLKVGVEISRRLPTYIAQLNALKKSQLKLEAKILPLESFLLPSKIWEAELQPAAPQMFSITDLFQL